MKLQNFDDQGEPEFLGELEAFQHLMCQDADPRLWPLLLEFGLAFVDKIPCYYLGIEYLDGEYPDIMDCGGSVPTNYI